jgi:DNA polymerase III subunit gamma/tau
MASLAPASPYQVIARKYRPQTFADLIGQEHVRTTLENAITASRVAHGYIFSGQRGTGKTTVARILARCLNCIQGPTIHPCGVCSSCKEISAGNAVDVIEIDAASNRGINEMRELRDNVRYRPARDRYKVFIIDEAHQITNEAFNALLKTLEEPPEWAVFMMCTTEAHKIPNTIISRCQQFNFRSVEFSELMKRLEYIAGEEGIGADADSLAVIARVGEGSVRDSLSALDQAIACCGKTLRAEEVRALLGVHAVDTLAAVAEAVIGKNPQRMLEIVQDLERNGQSLQHYVRELSRYWRNLLVARIAGQRTHLIAASDREQDLLIETAARFSEEDLTRYLNLTLDLYRAMQYSLQPRLHLELGLVKLVHAGRLQSIEDAIAGLGGDKGRTSPPREAASRASAPRPAPFETRTVAPAPPRASSVANPASSRPPLSIQGAPAGLGETASQLSQPLRRIVEQVHTPASGIPVPPQLPPLEGGSGEADFKAQLIELLGGAASFRADALSQTELILNGSELRLRAPKAFQPVLRDAEVAKAAQKLAGRPIRIVIETAASASPIENPTPAPQNDAEFSARVLDHPGVKRFQELFPGAHVRTVRNLNE